MTPKGSVKPTIGMRVFGDMGESGVIVAMTKEWCIYEVRHAGGATAEYAEPWDDIAVVVAKPDHAEGGVAEGPEVPVAEE